tara:strand:+ start:8827 stop:13158 length:4332 start_codon:yes stop_codon:yes gene_type:complete
MAETELEKAGMVVDVIPDTPVSDAPVPVTDSMPALVPAATGGQSSLYSYTFTPQNFEAAIRDLGLKNVVTGIVDSAAEQRPGLFSYETIKDGTAPLLDQLPGYKDLSSEQRATIFSNDEAFLPLFTNVEDFGKYTEEGREGAGYQAIIERVKRTALPAAGATTGFVGGIRAAAPIANLIPPSTPAGIFGRGLVYLTGGVLGSLTLQEAGKAGSEAVFGEDYAVIPSLQASNNFGETLTYGMSALASPLIWSRKAVEKGGTGAVQFLDGFSKVARGEKFKGLSDKAIESAAKELGLTTKQFRRALELERAGGVQTMFSKTGPGLNLGITRFSPTGQLIDPTKGPAWMRAYGGIEKGVGTSMQAARKNPIPFIGFETTAAGGAASLAYVSENLFPGETGPRLLMEVAGAALPPLIARPLMESVPAGLRAAKRVITEYYTGERKGILEGRMKKDAARRIFNALDERIPKEAPGVFYLNDETGDFQVIAQDAPDLIEQANSLKSQGYVEGTPLDVLIKAFEAGAIDPQTGEIIPITAASLAQASGLPLARTLGIIEQELAQSHQELALASKDGREVYIQASKAAIMALTKEGSPEAMTTAALIQQKLFEENIFNNVEAATTRLTSAFGRVFGDQDKEAPDVSRRLEYGEQLYKTLINQLNISKKREKELWGQIRNYPVTRFFDKDGSELNRPNMVEIFDIPRDDGGLKFSNKGGTGEIMKALGTYAEDVQEILNFYIGRTVTKQAPEIKAAEIAARKIRGTNYGDQFLKFISDNQIDLKGVPQTDDPIRLLREEAAKYSGKLATPATKRYADALNKQADMLVARMDSSRGSALMPQGVDGAPLNYDRLFELRSHVLDQASKARASGDSYLAGNLDLLGASITQDLTGMPSDIMAETGTEAAVKAYNTARSYTRARNRVWNEGILGEVQTFDGRTRDLRIDPESFVHRLFQGGENPVLQRLNEMQAAKLFMQKEFEGEKVVVDEAETIMDTMEKLIRDVRKNIVTRKTDPETGKVSFVVNQGKLDSYKALPETQAVFRIFPSLALDLADLESAQRLVNTTLIRGTDSEKYLPTLAFKAVLENAESPSKAIATALSIRALDPQSGNRVLKPTGGLNELLRLAKSQDTFENPVTGQTFTQEEALSGLKTAVFDYAVTASGGTGFSFSPKRMSDILFTRVKGTSPNENFILVDWMKKNNLMTENEIKLLEQNLSQMIDVETAFFEGNLERILFQNPTPSKSLMVAMFGATGGQKMQETLNKLLQRLGLGTTGGGIGGGMVAAQKGSTIAQDLILRGPESTKIDYMVEMMKNSRLMALMLKTIKDEKDAENTFSAINKALGGGATQVGRRLPYVQRALGEEPVPAPPEETEEAPAPEPQASVQAPQQNLMAQRFAQPTPTVIQPRPAAPAPAPVQPQGEANPQQREQLAAMFPNDPLLQAAGGRGGIGSLFS